MTSYPIRHSPIPLLIFIALAGLSSSCLAAPDPLDSARPPESAAKMSESEIDERSKRRYEEMLGKMQAAIEEIAQLYGSPTFLQVFTNDEEKARELKERLSSVSRGEKLRKDMADLEKKHSDLLDDIALREKEVRRLSERLVRQRSALEAMRAALDQARKAAEDSAP